MPSPQICPLVITLSGCLLAAAATTEVVTLPNVELGSTEARWWRRIEDGLLLRCQSDKNCPRREGSSLWADVEVPTETSPPLVITVEVEHNGRWLFEADSSATLSDRVTLASHRCSDHGGKHAQSLQATRGVAECASYQPGSNHRAASEKNGQKFCEHKEAKEARAFFCRYPPRFYGHQGICNQYAQFCPFQELHTETDASRIETAVVNIDQQLFHRLEDCGVLKQELWIFKVFVHWCPHCQQLMPRLFRLALILRQRGAKLRFGAVNCATEHDLCASQKWHGHPLLVARYLGPDRALHDAIEHWVDTVKDAQLREMLPRYALPGEFPLLKVLLEQLPEELAPRAAWQPLFEEPSVGACPNVSALHPVLPANVDETVGNGWSDAEANFTLRHHWTDALLALRHTLQEWIVPLADDGNAEAFSLDQIEAAEAWIALLARNLPSEFGLTDILTSVSHQLRAHLRAAHVKDSDKAALCKDEWKALVAPVLKAIADVGQQSFTLPSVCASETCRLWSLLHTLAGECWRRQEEHAEGSSRHEPSMLLSGVHDFIHEFFKCLYCRRHFLQQFDAGTYGLEQARIEARETVLYFWRLHNAVSVKVVAEHGCLDVDRRWPPTSICQDCWEQQSGESWDVLAETAQMQAEGKLTAMPRSLAESAAPKEDAILGFLSNAFGGPRNLTL